MINEKIKKLADCADVHNDAMDYLGRSHLNLRDEFFAESIIKECINIIQTDMQSVYAHSPQIDLNLYAKSHLTQLLANNFSLDLD